MTAQPNRGGFLIGRPVAGVATAVVLAMLVSPHAFASTQLLSRRSYIRTNGGSGADAFDRSSGTETFDRFADNVRDENMPEDLASMAHQFSSPGVGDGGLVGAYAEGSVKASPDWPGGMAHAQSEFDLVFRVTDAPTEFSIGAAFGCVGEASTLVQLVSVRDPSHGIGSAPIFAAWLDAAGSEPEGSTRTLDRSGVLDPGTYALSIHADSNITPNEAAEGTAYYNVNVTFAAPASSAVPLPPAVVPGLVALAGMAAAQWKRRRG